MKTPKQRAEILLRHWQGRTPVLFIGGTGLESDSNATMQVFNPANGDVLARCPAGNASDIDRAVEAAHHAWDSQWRDTSPQERADILWKAAEVFEQYATDLAILESAQTGKTYREVLTHDVPMAVSTLKYYAGWAGKRSGEHFRLGERLTGFTYPEPVPVVGGILRWTFPLASAVWTIAPALAGGSCCVLKPSEMAPLTVLRVAELFNKANLPGGVINVVTGTGHPAGEALAMHPKVHALTFSGSVESARRILVSAAKSNLKQVFLHLGGKSANIIFEDADIQSAIGAAWKAGFFARGQVASAGSRLLVHEKVYDEVVSVVTSRARQIVLGDPLDDHTEMGPVVSEPEMKRVLSYVDVGRKEGAKLVAGGARDVEDSRSAGFFVKPTVFMDVTPRMRVAQEEILGPVVCIMKFRDENEALRVANGTDYALAGAVWTKDLGRAHRVARKLNAGVVWINQYGHFDPSMPYGGSGLSGHGRVFGQAAMDAFSGSKSIYLPDE